MQLCKAHCHPKQPSSSTNRCLVARSAAGSCCKPVQQAGTAAPSSSRGRHQRPAAYQPQRSPLDSDDYEDVEHEVPVICDPGQQTAGSKSDDGQKQQRTQQPPPQQPQQEDPAAGQPGGGLVGLFVAGWMAVLSVLMQLLSPFFSLGLFVAQPLTQTNPVRARAKNDNLVTQLPQGFWARLHYVWERPVVKSIRITASIANWSVRLPAIAALLLAQGGAMASTISFPMLAPLLLGTGMMMRSIKANASFIIPRLGLMVVLLWVLWFFTNVIQTTWVVLCKQGRIDLRTLAGARMITECTSLLLAGIVVLSLAGINISALLLPAGVVLAIASRDLLQNFIAGFFLVLAQPFRLGDKVAVSCAVPSSGTQSFAATAVKSTAGTAAAAAAGSYSTADVGRSTAANGSSSTPPGWFEGVCEKVDLRYTVLRDGRRRLMVPNTAFVSREFMVYDDGPEALKPTSSMGSSTTNPWWWHGKARTPSQDQAAAAATAGQPGSSEGNSPRGQQPANRQQPGRAASPEPAIIEGHMTTQLPPVAPTPVYPGMHFVAPHHPAYSPFPPMHYQQQPVAGYPYQDPFFAQQQQQQQQEAGAYGMPGWQQQQQPPPPQQPPVEQDDQHQQQQQHQPQDPPMQPTGDDQHQQEQHQQQQQQEQTRSQPVAKGPPGYLPQSFVAASPYLGIPVGTLYYGVPGVMPWPASGPGRPPSQPAGAAPEGTREPRPQQQGGQPQKGRQSRQAEQQGQAQRQHAQQQHAQQQHAQQQHAQQQHAQQQHAQQQHAEQQHAQRQHAQQQHAQQQQQQDSRTSPGTIHHTDQGPAADRADDGVNPDSQGNSSSSSSSSLAARSDQLPQGTPSSRQQPQHGSQASLHQPSSRPDHPHAVSGHKFSTHPHPGLHHNHQQLQGHSVQQAPAPPTGVKQGAGASHNMHMAAGAGFGVWGMAPARPQLWEQQYPGHSMQYPGHVVMTHAQSHGYMPPDAWAGPRDSTSGTHFVQPGPMQPGSPHVQQGIWQAPAGATGAATSSASAAAAAVDSGAGSAHVRAVVDPVCLDENQASPDSNPSDNLVLAVLQEISRQQQL